MSAVLATSESSRELPRSESTDSWPLSTSLRLAEPPTNQPSTWGRVWAWTMYLSWQLLTKGVLSVIYFTLIADGMAQLSPALARKLHKVSSSLSWLQDYEATYQLTVAQLAALVFMVLVWIAWTWVLTAWVKHEETGSSANGLPKRVSDVFTVLAVILLIGDCCLFYMSLVHATWSGTPLSISALLGTVVYAAVVVVAVLFSIYLKRQCVRPPSQES